MQPIQTRQTNFNYVGPDPSVAMLPCCKTSDGRVISVWEPTAEERQRIAAGENIELHVWMQPPPPVGMLLTKLTRSASPQPHTAVADLPKPSRAG
jgi:hypothetical protein